jgi:hypothetical protein
MLDSAVQFRFRADGAFARHRIRIGGSTVGDAPTAEVDLDHSRVDGVLGNGDVRHGYRIERLRSDGG